MFISSLSRHEATAWKYLTALPSTPRGLGHACQEILEEVKARSSPLPKPHTLVICTLFGPRNLWAVNSFHIWSFPPSCGPSLWWALCWHGGHGDTPLVYVQAAKRRSGAASLCLASESRFQMAKEAHCIEGTWQPEWIHQCGKWKPSGSCLKLWEQRTLGLPPPNVNILLLPPPASQSLEGSKHMWGQHSIPSHAGTYADSYQDPLLPKEADGDGEGGKHNHKSSRSGQGDNWKHSPPRSALQCQSGRRLGQLKLEKAWAGAQLPLWPGGFWWSGYFSAYEMGIRIVSMLWDQRKHFKSNSSDALRHSGVFKAPQRFCLLSHLILFAPLLALYSCCHWGNTGECELWKLTLVWCLEAMQVKEHDWGGALLRVSEWGPGPGHQSWPVSCPGYQLPFPPRLSEIVFWVSPWATAPSRWIMAVLKGIYISFLYSSWEVGWGIKSVLKIWAKEHSPEWCLPRLKGHRATSQDTRWRFSNTNAHMMVHGLSAGSEESVIAGKTANA